MNAGDPPPPKWSGDSAGERPVPDALRAAAIMAESIEQVAEGLQAIAAVLAEPEAPAPTYERQRLDEARELVTMFIQLAESAKGAHAAATSDGKKGYIDEHLPSTALHLQSAASNFMRLTEPPAEDVADLPD